MKFCTKCKVTKDESEFNKANSKPDGLASSCRDCTRAAVKKHYYNNKQYYIDKNIDTVNRAKGYINSKKIQCSSCKENDIVCLEFHHVDPSKKERNLGDIASRGWSNKRIDKEIEKCIVLCSNCHRKLHRDLKLGISVIG